MRRTGVLFSICAVALLVCGSLTASSQEGKGASADAVGKKVKVTLVRWPYT